MQRRNNNLFFSPYKAVCLLLFSLFTSCGGSDETDPVLENTPAYGAFIDDYTYKVFSTENVNFGTAEFRLWVPEETTKDVRAVAVLTHSYNSNGLGYANSPLWQDFATRENIALLAVHLKNREGAAVSYTEAHRGSGEAMLKSLGILADKIGKSYIKDLPLLMRGYSAGGVFSYSFSAYRPERMLAFANIRGGSLSETGEKNLRIPGLLIYGELDAAQRNSRIFQLIADKREAGANWALIKELETDHFGELDKSENIIQLFFSEVLQKGLVQESEDMKVIAEEEGWLGDNVRLETYTFNDYPYDASKASWLISEKFAEQWLDFQN